MIKYDASPIGISIEINHNVPSGAGKSFRWVQTLASNHPFIKACKLPYIVDPFGNWDLAIHKRSLPGLSSVCKADDLKPFYWSDAEFGTYGPDLVDQPKTAEIPPSGRYWWNFVTALAEVVGKNVHNLVAISWGYDRMASGKIQRGVVKRANAIQMKHHLDALKKMYSAYSFS